MNHIFKHLQERRQHAEIELLKEQLRELNEDYTEMSAEVQKNDQGNYPTNFPYCLLSPKGSINFKNSRKAELWVENSKNKKR